MIWWYWLGASHHFFHVPISQCIESLFFLIPDFWLLLKTQPSK